MIYGHAFVREMDAISAGGSPKNKVDVRNFTGKDKSPMRLQRNRVENENWSEP